jgi:hypothetical protein
MHVVVKVGYGDGRNNSSTDNTGSCPLVDFVTTNNHTSNTAYTEIPDAFRTSFLGRVV